MDKRHRDKYGALMLEVIHRVSVLDDFATGRSNTTYVRTNTESMYLQLRKVLELVAFSSLVSHKSSYASVRAQFARDWHAARILKKVENLNPNFYPQPIANVTQCGFTRPRGGFLTRGQFQRLYDKCGAVMHATNPFRAKRNFNTFSDQVPEHVDRIKTLLTEHTVQLIGSSDALWVSVPFDDDESPVIVRHLVERET